MSSPPLCFPPAWAPSHRGAGATPAQGCPGSVLCHYPASEPGLPGVGIARRLPGDNLPHSLHAPRCAPDSRPAGSSFLAVETLPRFSWQCTGSSPTPGALSFSHWFCWAHPQSCFGYRLGFGFCNVTKAKGAESVVRCSFQPPAPFSKVPPSTWHHSEHPCSASQWCTGKWEFATHGKKQ